MTYSLAGINILKENSTYTLGRMGVLNLHIGKNGSIKPTHWEEWEY